MHKLYVIPKERLLKLSVVSPAVSVLALPDSTEYSEASSQGLQLATAVLGSSAHRL